MPPAGQVPRPPCLARQGLSECLAGAEAAALQRRPPGPGVRVLAGGGRPWCTVSKPGGPLQSQKNWEETEGSKCWRGAGHTLILLCTHSGHSIFYFVLEGYCLAVRQLRASSLRSVPHGGHFFELRGQGSAEHTGGCGRGRITDALCLSRRPLSPEGLGLLTGHLQGSPPPSPSQSHSELVPCVRTGKACPPGRQRHLLAGAGAALLQAPPSPPPAGCLEKFLSVFISFQSE